MSLDYKECHTCGRTKHMDAFYESTTECKSCFLVRSANRQSKQVKKRLLSRNRTKTLYILTHPTFDGYYRLGSTSDLTKRLSLYRTSIPTPDSLDLIHTHDSPVAEYLEWILCDILDTHPQCIERQQSFFKIDQKHLLDIVTQVIEHEEASLGHRNEQPMQPDLVLCN